MSLNATPSGERVHIGLFGNRNAGKSSIINAITGQKLSIVSDTAGTTTDPVYKAMELLPLGPVMLIDTPGVDDEGELGQLRVEKSLEVLGKTDIALLITGSHPLSPMEEMLIENFKTRKVPYLVVRNKADLLETVPDSVGENEIYVSALTGMGIVALKERIAALKPKETEKHIISDLLSPLDLIVLVVPIDESAPKGRLILPQQQTIRDILEAGAIAVVVKDTELEDTLKKLGTKPKLVITDSQVFGTVAKIVPEDILLTSFSILMARYKGTLDATVAGVRSVKDLQDGDTVLISEGCTHHRQCQDIGTVKIPRLLQKFTEKNLNFAFTSGREFPQDLSPYALVVHCGGCTLNEKEMLSRQQRTTAQGIPFTNYGIFLAMGSDILDRSLELFPEYR